MDSIFLDYGKGDLNRGYMVCHELDGYLGYLDVTIIVNMGNEVEKIISEGVISDI